ncbi:uncharacterized protein PRCAT00003644001 [Priceomyces carsonii]|uniref:uncharacterized protein n=1 Tax=Priceomyces carsonii TaxID=28549 RepID=UPI002EDAFA6E|nr:unnamed protein product [Priceomyces carsonii]
MSSYAVFEKIGLTGNDVLCCSYSKWSPIFKDHIFESVKLQPLPKSFIKYLSSDSIRLTDDKHADDINLNSENDYSDWEEDEENNEAVSSPEIQFQELHNDLIESIRNLGGKVFPKLNWSAPKDAAWMLPSKSMECNTADDVYLLLNASDHIADDLDHAFDDCEGTIPNFEYELVLKKWVDLNPALEFRLFIKDKKLVGISQRDLNFYEFLTKLEPMLRSRLSKFWEEIVVPSRFGVISYIMDVYIPSPYTEVYIIDINPLSRKSDPLLFTWNEILTADNETFDFRLVTENNVHRFSRKEYSESQVPLDMIDAAVNNNSMVELAREWTNAQKRQPK